MTALEKNKLFAMAGVVLRCLDVLPAGFLPPVDRMETERMIIQFRTKGSLHGC